MITGTWFEVTHPAAGYTVDGDQVVSAGGGVAKLVITAEGHGITDWELVKVDRGGGMTPPSAPGSRQREAGDLQR